MQAINLIEKGFAMKPWSGDMIAEVGSVGARLFHFTPDKEMVVFEEGHEYNEWLLVLRGEVIVQTPETTVAVRAGESFIVPPGTQHRLNVNEESIGLIVRDMKVDPAKSIPNAVVDKK